MRVVKLSSSRRLAFDGLKAALRIPILIGLMLLPCVARAQSDFTLDWFAVAAGGGDSSGGDFELSATLGQPDAGDMAGGDFAILGGFWSIVLEPEPPTAFSVAVRLDQGSVVISWPATGSAGFLLEEALTLATPTITWNPVNVAPQSSDGSKSVRLPLAAGSRFYRLHKP